MFLQEMPKKLKYSKLIEKIQKKKIPVRRFFTQIRYEFEYFSFLFIAVLFSTGNAKKNVFTVFTVPIVTIGAFLFSSVVNLEPVKVSASHLPEYNPYISCPM